MGQPHINLYEAEIMFFWKATSMYNDRKKVLRLKVCGTFFMHPIVTGFGS